MHVKQLLAPTGGGTGALHTATFYPDAHPETTSVDGQVADGPNDITWAALIARPGNISDDVAAFGAIINISASGTLNQWMTLYRSIFLFDTSSLPDVCSIISAILYIRGRAAKVDSAGITPDMNVYASNPASDIALVPGDFNSLGGIPLCDTPITYAGWLEGAISNQFALNPAGLAAISKTGITKLGVRNANYDVSGTPPAWTRLAGSTLYCYFAEQGGALRPTLVVEYMI